MHEAPAGPPDLVACLCADWCHICGRYRAVFDALASEAAATARFVWLDIEDDEDLLGSVEVKDFPTLLVARGGRVLFFGPVQAAEPSTRELLRRVDDRPAGAIDDAGLQVLVARLRTRR